jgi:hypothetical protein
MISDKLEKGAKNFAKELSVASAEGQSGMKGIGSAAGKVFGKGGMIAVGLIGIGALLYGAYKLISNFDDKASATAKNLGMGSKEVTEMADAMNDAGIAMEKGLKLAEAINAEHGGVNAINKNNVKQYNEQLKAMSNMVRNLGVTEAETAAIAYRAELGGSSFERMSFNVLSVTKNLESQGVYLVNQSKVLRDIAKMSLYNAGRFNRGGRN